MSKHVRARSGRPARTRAPRQRNLRALAVAAGVGLLVFAAGWVHVARDTPEADAARAHQDSRPKSATDRAARGEDRARPRGSDALPGLSKATRKRIPADSRQLIVVTGKAVGSSESVVTLWSRSAPGGDWNRADTWPARNGAKGWSAPEARTYGDLTSPQGVYSLTDAGGLLPKPPGTRFPYDEDDGFVATGTGVNGEPLTGAFDYVVAIDFNRERGVSPLDPSKPQGEERGGNIWLHVDHDGPSQGCVGIPKEAMKKLLQTLDPASKPVVVMGPQGF
ncbi:L,D-transpeptidase family protein [Streptomyces sp. NPDC102278]|uniref:L,D-transpeptidase family protein n=1 Tax=Streptomyces sp. NPDC102278 TaxID=3366152 RepID=UPI0038292B8D